MPHDSLPTQVSKGELTERSHSAPEIVRVEDLSGNTWEYRLLPYDAFLKDDLVDSMLNQTPPPDIARVSEELYSIATSSRTIGETLKVETSRLITQGPDGNLYTLTSSPPGKPTETYDTQSLSSLIPPDHSIFIEGHNHPEKAAKVPSGEGFSLGDLNHADPLQSHLNYTKSPMISTVATEGGVYLAMYPAQLQKLFQFGEKLISKLSENSLGKKIANTVIQHLHEWQTNRENKKIKQEVPIYTNYDRTTSPSTKERLRLQKIVAKNRGVRVYFMNYNDRLAFRIV